MWPSEVISGCQEHRGDVNIMLTGQYYVLCTVPVLLVVWLTLPVGSREPWEIYCNNIQLYNRIPTIFYNAAYITGILLINECEKKFVQVRVGDFEFEPASPVTAHMISDNNLIDSLLIVLIAS